MNIANLVLLLRLEKRLSQQQHKTQIFLILRNKIFIAFVKIKHDNRGRKRKSVKEKHEKKEKRKEQEKKKKNIIAIKYKIII